MKNNNLRKITHLTLVTAVSVGPTLAPIVAQAEEIERLNTNETNETVEIIQETTTSIQEDEGWTQDLLNIEERLEVAQASIDETETVEPAETTLVEMNLEARANVFDLNDWTYTETVDEIILSAYTGSSTDIYIPGEWNGKQVVLTNLNILPNDIAQLQIQEVNAKKVKLQITNLSQAFSRKPDLTTLDLSGLDVSNVTTMRETFKNLKNLTTLDVSGWDTSNVTDMSYMFDGLISLITLDLSDFDTSNVTNMNHMFYGLYNLATLDISNFNTSKVTDMSYMFYDLNNLTALDVSHFDTSNVTNMSWMFNRLENLMTLDVSNFDTSKVTNMRGMFNEMLSLITLDVSHFDTSNVTDMRYMFSGLSSLTTLDLSGWNTSNVMDMGEMFYETYNVTTLDLSGWNTSNVRNMYAMFYDMSSLTSLDVSHFDTSNVTDMRYMFRYVNTLTTLDLSGWNTSNVTTMRGMFFGMSNLTSLEVSHFDTSNVTDMAGMFIDTPNLITLDLSGWNTANVRDMDDMFYLLRPRPLLLITTDKNLKNYNFKADQRTGSKMTFRTNDGNFSNGTTEWISPEIFTIDSREADAVHEWIRLIGNSNGVPVRDGFVFRDWVTNDAGITNELESIYHQLNATYEAQWSAHSSTINLMPFIIATDKTITVGDVFNPLEGVKAYDPEEGEIILTEANIVSNNVDPLTPGTYEVVYQVSDSQGATATKTITVVVKDVPVNQLPVIDAQDKTITVGDVFNPLEGVKAYDPEEGEIILTEANIVSNNVDPLTPGTYEVVYQVSDSQGATATKTITVVVKDVPVNQLPVIDAQDKTITVGDVFNPLEGVKAYDPEEGEIILTEANIVSNNVDPLTPGTYEVVYQVSDSQGATATKTITVIVQEKAENEINPDDNNNNGGSTPDVSTDDNNNVDVDSSGDVNDEGVKDPLIPENQPNQEHLTNNPAPDREVVETGFSMGANLLLGFFSLFQGMAFWRRQKK